MWIEYSNKKVGSRTLYVYGFAAWEKKVLLSGIPAAIQKYEKLILKVKTNPRNEGQVEFSDQIRNLQHQINDLKEIQKNFEEDIEVFNRGKPKYKQV